MADPQCAGSWELVGLEANIPGRLNPDGAAMGANCFNGGGFDDGFGVREALLGSDSTMDEVMLTRSSCPQPLLVSTRVTFNHFLCPDSTIWNSNRSDQAAFCGLIGPSTLSKPWFRAQLMSTQSSFD